VDKLEQLAVVVSVEPLTTVGLDSPPLDFVTLSFLSASDDVESRLLFAVGEDFLLELLADVVVVAVDVIVASLETTTVTDSVVVSPLLSSPLSPIETGLPTLD